MTASGEKQAIYTPIISIRDLMLANSLVLLARMNRRLSQAGANTYVASMADWREERLGQDLILLILVADLSLIC